MTMQSKPICHSPSGHHRVIIGSNTIQDYDSPKRTVEAMRRKIGPSVNLNNDGSFLIDRQLEDQRCLMTKNNNPQLDVPTNADKTRSQMIMRKKVRSSSVKYSNLKLMFNLPSVYIHSASLSVPLSLL
jgi:hypothetical protein